MLAALSVLAKSMGAKRIVFDALDIVLALLPDATAVRREVYRLHGWLLECGLTGLITAKAGDDENTSLAQESFSFMQFVEAMRHLGLYWLLWNEPPPVER